MASNAKSTYSKRSARDEKIAKKRVRKSRKKLAKLKDEGKLGVTYAQAS